MKYLIKSILLLILATSYVYASPKLLLKDKSGTRFLQNLNGYPAALQPLIAEKYQQQPDLYEIIVTQQHDYYLLYFLSGKMWKATKVKVQIDNSGQPHSLVDNEAFEETENKPDNQEQDDFACPDNNIQFVVISAYPHVGSVNEAIRLVSEAANKKYKTMTLLDENIDAKIYKNWLSCPNLKGFYSISHGLRDGIVVGKGDFIGYEFFRKKQFNNLYKDTIVIMNACQSYNYPFGTQLMYGNAMYNSTYNKSPGPNAYEYVGGHTNLLMDVSELSSACLMVKALEGGKIDYDTLKLCIGSQDMHYQNFGISQPGRTMK